METRFQRTGYQHANYNAVELRDDRHNSKFFTAFRPPVPTALARKVLRSIQPQAIDTPFPEMVSKIFGRNSAPVPLLRVTPLAPMKTLRALTGTRMMYGHENPMVLRLVSDC